MTCGEITVTDIGVVFDGIREVQAIKDLTFKVNAAKFVSVLGPTGCGKSTILNVLAGFIKPTTGSATLDGTTIVGPGRDRGIVFQHHALFPWMTVLGNVAFGLKCQGLPSDEVSERTTKFLEYVGLQRFADAYPGELSGGMQQRVGLARVLINDPKVLLMDEPFGALDAQTRLVMQELLLNIFRNERKTVVFVTHDVDEGILLSDILLVLTAQPGQIKARIEVDIPQPRNHLIFELPRFIQIKRQVMELIREETMKLDYRP